MSMCHTQPQHPQDTGKMVYKPTTIYSSVYCIVSADWNTYPLPPILTVGTGGLLKIHSCYLHSLWAHLVTMNCCCMNLHIAHLALARWVIYCPLKTLPHRDSQWLIAKYGRTLQGLPLTILIRSFRLSMLSLITSILAISTLPLLITVLPPKMGLTSGRLRDHSYLHFT